MKNKDELLEYILAKAGIDISEKEKYRWFVYGKLDAMVEESRNTVRNIVSEAMESDMAVSDKDGI